MEGDGKWLGRRKAGEALYKEALYKARDNWQEARRKTEEALEEQFQIVT